MRNLHGKVVVLTGAASGIGRALAVGLAADGAELALCDIDAEGLRRTAELAAGSPAVSTHVVDVSDRDGVEAFARAVQQRHGAVDVLINNAGLGCVATVEEASYDDFARIIDVNLWGVIHGVKAFLPLLRQRPEAHIVNVASVNAMVPFPTNGPYNVSKFGVDALSQTLMAELSGSSITVSCVYPGGVKTNIAKNARHVSEDDVRGFERRAMLTPDRAAGRIIRGIKRGRRRIVVGVDAKMLALLWRLSLRASLGLVTWGWRRIAQPSPAPGAGSPHPGTSGAGELP